MDQAIEQSVVDTAAAEPQEVQEQAEPKEAESTTSKEDNAIDYSSLGSMSQQEQLAALSKAGIFDSDKPADKPQETPQQAETPEKEQSDGQAEKAPQNENEPEFEVVVDGQKVKVKQSELLAGYQRQADYTRKTQELAEQRRQADAMMAALKVQQQTNPAPHEDKPKDKVQAEYEQVVARAAQELGIKPEDFNQYDPRHAFALQKATLERVQEQAERQQVDSEIAEFAAQAKNDPMTQTIDQNFNVYLFKMAAESPEQANKAMQIMQAANRLQNKQATKADTKMLREHWEYVRKALSTPAAPAAPAAPTPPKVEPPKTETPGKSDTVHTPFDPSKLGHMNTQQQMAALKRAGIFR